MSKTLSLIENTGESVNPEYAVFMSEETSKRLIAISNQFKKVPTDQLIDSIILDGLDVLEAGLVDKKESVENADLDGDE